MITVIKNHKFFFIFSENAVKEITDLLQGPKNKGRILEKILWKVSQYVQSKEQEKIAMEDYMRQQIETREEKVSFRN